LRHVGDDSTVLESNERADECGVGLLNHGLSECHSSFCNN
jgi:hypothetical protein